MHGGPASPRLCSASVIADPTTMFPNPHNSRFEGLTTEHAAERKRLDIEYNAKSEEIEVQLRQEVQSLGTKLNET